MNEEDKKIVRIILDMDKEMDIDIAKKWLIDGKESKHI